MPPPATKATTQEALDQGALEQGASEQGAPEQGASEQGATHPSPLEDAYLDNTDPFDTPSTESNVQPNEDSNEEQSHDDIDTDYTQEEGAWQPDIERIDDEEIEATETIDDKPSRPTRERKPPSNYVPTFGGKKYSMQLFNYAIKNTAKDKAQVQNFDIRTNTFNVIFTQMTADKGIKEFGANAIAAIYKEYKQMEDMKVLGVLDASKLMNDQKRRALRAVNLIKLKRSGKLKACMCANGAPQRKYIPCEEAKSPMVSTDGLLSTAVIAAFERRYVITFDVPGACLHADIPEDKFRILKLEGKYVDIMCTVNPEYADYVIEENGKKVLYLQIPKALYGMIESALLWYQLFLSVLTEQGFTLNPYDPCIANKMVNGKQCTIAWYVDDNMISHVEKEVVEDIVSKIEEKFPGLTITRGKVHDFIGMKFTFRDDGKLDVDLRDYLKEAISDFGEDLGPQVSTVAGKWLFEINDKARKLPIDKAEIFHSIVAKLLWVAQRGRPDISTPISFLCSRIKEPDVEDKKKLRRVLKFIAQTIDDVRTIGADCLSEMTTYVDSSHAVHPDMRGHTGGAITFGTGIVTHRSSKQKMNSRSSNKTEVIGNSEFLPTNIWYQNFLEAQGYPLSKNYFLQDNKGAEKMAKNGRISSGSNSRHINIKFF